MMKKPRRPLNPYQRFFREERARVLGLSLEETGISATHAGDYAASSAEDPSIVMSKQKQQFQEELQNRKTSTMTMTDEEKLAAAYEPSAMKRKHRKTHGKISFQELSSHVSKAWKKLDPQVKEQYQTEFGILLDKFKKDLKLYYKIHGKPEDDGKKEGKKRKKGKATENKEGQMAAETKKGKLPGSLASNDEKDNHEEKRGDSSSFEADGEGQSKVSSKKLHEDEVELVGSSFKKLASLRSPPEDRTRGLGSGYSGDGTSPNKLRDRVIAPDVGGLRSHIPLEQVSSSFDPRYRLDARKEAMLLGPQLAARHHHVGAGHFPADLSLNPLQRLLLHPAAGGSGAAQHQAPPHLNPYYQYLMASSTAPSFSGAQAYLGTDGLPRAGGGAPFPPLSDDGASLLYARAPPQHHHAVSLAALLEEERKKHEGTSSSDFDHSRRFDLQDLSRIQQDALRASFLPPLNGGGATYLERLQRDLMGSESAGAVKQAPSQEEVAAALRTLANAASAGAAGVTSMDAAAVQRQYDNNAAAASHQPNSKAETERRLLLRLLEEERLRSRLQQH